MQYMQQNASDVHILLHISHKSSTFATILLTKHFFDMKKISSLLFALMVLAGANAGERLMLSHRPLNAKVPAAVLADETQKAPAQLAGTTIDIVCDSVHLYDISGVVGYDVMQIVSANDAYSVSIMIAKTQYYGTYDGNIGITPKATGAAQITAEGKVTLGEEDSRILVTSTVTASDGNTYNIRMKQAAIDIPECKDTVTINIPKATFANKLQAEDAFMIQGKTADLMYAASFQPTNVGGKVAGTYTASQLNNLYSFVVYDPWNATDDDFVEFLDGTVKITVVGKEITVVAGMVGTDAIYYKITMTAEYDDVVRLTADAETGSVDRTYTAGIDNVTVDTDYASQGAIYVDAMSANGADYTTIGFICANTDKDIVIPAGEYPINYTNAVGSVMASTGINSDNQVYPSYYSTISNNMLVHPIFFMVSGKAVVENNNGELKITVDAQNSYDRPIHVVINAGLQTAIDQVNADAAQATKYIKDGQMYILRNGNVYTTTGTLVK